MIVQNLKSRNIFCSIQGKPSGDTSVQLIEDLFPLIGVTSVNVQWQHEVGVRQGITANFLQPWYNKPVEIEIQGESYMGMFGGQSLSSELAKQQDNKQKQVDNNDIIKKGLKNVNAGIAALGQGVLDGIKFTTGISIPLGSEDVLKWISNRVSDIPEEDIAKFFGNIGDKIKKYYNWRLETALAEEGKSKEAWLKFITNFSAKWNSSNLPLPFQAKNMGSLENLITNPGGILKNIAGVTEAAAGAGAIVAQKGISTAMRKMLDLLKSSLGPKEDRTVYNLKKIISYYRYGPFQYKGESYTNLEHVLVMENEPGQGAPTQEGSFSTFIGVIRDFSYQESIENPFVHEYTVRFIGLPDTQSILTKSKEQAATDSKRGGITLTLHSSKDILNQGIGLLQQIPKPAVPTIPGL